MVWLLTLAGFLIAMGAMAIGVILTGRRLQGSCGGVSGGACLCKPGDEPAQCPKKSAPAAATKVPTSHRALDILSD